MTTRAVCPAYPTDVVLSFDEMMLRGVRGSR